MTEEVVVQYSRAFVPSSQRAWVMGMRLSGCSLGPLEAISELLGDCFGASWSFFWASSGSLLGLLGASWGRLEASWSLLGASWGGGLEFSVRGLLLAPSWNCLEAPVGRLGRLLGRLGAFLGACWEPLGLTWCGFESRLGRFQRREG